MTIAPLSPGVASDRGAAGKQNEDAYTFFKIGPGEWRAEAGQSLYVLVVADGVTSKVGGAQASRIATETIERTFQLKAPALLAQLNGTSESVITQFMSEVVHAANEEIRKVARRQPELGSMSTTLVLAVLAAGRLYVAHLGDSRAYLIRGRQIHRLTLDHNWVQDALDQQKMSLEEASVHPNRNVILRYLGIRDSIEVDHNIVVPGTYQEGLNRKYATSIPVEAGDLILLCSDGQTEKVPDQELLAIASSSPQQPQKAVDAMIQRALARREEDNITALLLAIPAKSQPWLYYGVGALLLLGVVVVALLFSGLWTAQQNNDGVATPPAAIALAGETPTATSEETTAETGAINVNNAAVAATAVPSETPTPSPSPAPTETATATATATPSPIPSETTTATMPPTSTSLPTDTPIPTATPQPSATATATATRTATSTTRTVTTPTLVPQRSTPVGQVFTIKEPINGGIRSGQIRIEWAGSTPPLASDERVDVVRWKKNQTFLQGQGFVDVNTINSNFITANLDEIGQGSGQALESGQTYQYAVVIVQMTPSWHVVSLASNIDSFHYQVQQRSDGPSCSGPLCGP